MTLLSKPLIAGSQLVSGGSVFAGMNAVNVVGTELSAPGDLLPVTMHTSRPKLRRRSLYRPFLDEISGTILYLVLLDVHEQTFPFSV